MTPPPTVQPKKTSRIGQLISLFVLLSILVLVVANWQSIYDWARLYNYNPPAEVAALATDTTMTDKSRRIFYVNRPSIEGKDSFSQNCPNNGGEQTIVLGCYLPPQHGIYVYQVTDAQLSGVQQVTAAHEMLHAAYDRLSSSERQRVNSLLENYYNNNVKDQRVRDVIAAYQKSEPNDVVNEMHSIFGTELAALPPELETYYSQYFSNRQKVVAYAAQYQGAFTSRRNLIAQYDAQLSALKKTIDANKSQLTIMANDLNSRRLQLDAIQRTNVDAYNAQVDAFNAQVAAYNALRSQTQTLISQYNQVVTKRNAVVLEEQNLVEALDSRLPSQTGQ